MGRQAGQAAPAVAGARRRRLRQDREGAGASAIREAQVSARRAPSGHALRRRAASPSRKPDGPGSLASGAPPQPAGPATPLSGHDAGASAPARRRAPPCLAGHERFRIWRRAAPGVNHPIAFPALAAGCPRQPDADMRLARMASAGCFDSLQICDMQCAEWPLPHEDGAIAHPSTRQMIPCLWPQCI